MNNKNFEKYFLISITLVFLVLSFLMLKEILSILIYAFLIAYLLKPLYSFFQNKIENKNLCSVLTVLTTIIGVIIPLFFLLYFLLLGAIKTIFDYREYIDDPKLMESQIENFISNFIGISNITISSLQNSIIKIFSYFVSIFEGVIVDVPRVIFLTLIVFFMVYYILLYDIQIKNFIKDTIPLSQKKQKEIIDKILLDMKVLFKGYFLTALLQTIVGVLGYIIFGVENLLLISFLTFILSILPYVGPALVWICLSFYFIVIGDYVNGFGLFLYGLLVISSVDNFVRPYLMSSKEFLPPPFVFIGIIGGILLFGISGIIIGPLIFSITGLFLKYTKEHYGF